MGLLLLLPLPLCAEVSTALDMLLRWHVEQVGGVVVAVAEAQYLCLAGLLDFDVVLECLDLMELLLGARTSLC